MGKPSQFPPGPVSQQCSAGREQFRRLFKAWSRQWSQPQLLKLTQAGLGDRVIHSSQLTGFATGTLLDPAPKVLLALGKFNRLLANSNSQQPDRLSSDPQPTCGGLPGTLKSLWEGREAMRTPEGQVMGPAEVFLAFTGELDLAQGDAREIPLEKEGEVSKAMGRYVRLTLATNGVDFVVEDRQRLEKAATSFKGLLSGKDVRGEQLLNDLPAIATELGTSDEELWDLISTTLAA